MKWNQRRNEKRGKDKYSWQVKTDQRFLFVIVLILACLYTLGVEAQQHETGLQFVTLTKEEGLPTDEVVRLYQDKDGFIWIATNEGLVCYDGCGFKTYKSNLYTPDLLSNNTITAIAEDNRHRLWIGTANGLNILDKLSGNFQRVDPGKLNNNLIQAIIATKKGDIWVGTEAGLHRYVAETDSFYLFTAVNSLPQLEKADVKTLFEDSQGQVWIGTWVNGFYRYNPATDRFYAYRQINPGNSAHIISEDSRGNIWIGTWGYGIFRLKDAYHPEHFTYDQYNYKKGSEECLSDSIVYAIEEDLNTGALWIGTRSGLSVLKETEEGVKIRNYLPEKGENSIPFNEVNALIRDKDNMMWIGMLGGGISMVNTRKRQFNLHRLKSADGKFSTNSVRSLFIDKDGYIWIGIGSYGLLRHDRQSGESVFYSGLADFKGVPISTVNMMIERKGKREIWFATYSGGIVIYDKDAPAGKRIRCLTPDNSSLINSRVYCLYEDSNQNIWIGVWGGVNVLTPGGEMLAFKNFDCFQRNGFISITEDDQKNIWLGTNQHGIFRLEGNPENLKTAKFVNYCSQNNKSSADNVAALYIDSRKRFWAGTEGEGLCLYDREKDKFVRIHDRLNLPGDVVASIVEDRQSTLWLGTNEGLVHLNVTANLDSSWFRLYTTADGLQDNIFVRSAVFKTPDGELFFGGHRGFNCFYPEKLQVNNHLPTVLIRNIKIFNRSWGDLPLEEKEAVSKQAPAFTDRIVLNHRQNNFSIEFAVLSYTNPDHNKYAFCLEGYDSKWIYTDETRNFAYYNNLKSGTYHFKLRGANENGIWNNAARDLEVVVLPAPWATWWAYGLYLLVIGWVIGYILFLVWKRWQTEAAVELAEIKRLKSEEINHAKLQFFTNITHELMTPLTIIQASLDELRVNTKSDNEYYGVISINTKRLIRLLQQILEFRKAESGNLKLRVTEGDLTAFVANSVDAFRPLIRQKKLQIAMVGEEIPVIGYFDPDKVDKILYNLLSNAAKYNRKGGYIQVKVHREAAVAVISVEDNGAGIAPEAMKMLYKRFYEGDYRRFNTTGTGIGLSLTKDLVDLHRGDIKVESKVGKGTKFTIFLPLLKETYDQEQIDEQIRVNTGETAEIVLPESSVEAAREEEKGIYTLLLVEDNEELRGLLKRRLGKEYRILEACNGKKAVDIVEKEEVNLVLTDIMMPEMDGLELCRYIKDRFELCHIPVLLLTAKQNEEDQISGYDCGANGYIRKPFRMELLLAKIRSLLRNREYMARNFKKQMALETKDLQYTSMDEAFIQKAIDCVYRHLDDAAFDQHQFTEEMGTSKSTLYTKLKSLTGLNTSAFIRNIRLKAACRIIEEKKKIRISELAYVVGFNDPKYFSTCFKKEFGMLPGDYMEEKERSGGK